jgi:ubiquinone/menaquinone biosynthesis C-methylase UbiE
MHGTKDAVDTAVGLTLVVGRRRIIEWVADAADVHSGTTVVDVGCGPGSAVREADRRGAIVIGVDPSAGMRRLARGLTRRHGGSKVQIQAGAAEHLPVPDGWADVVWAISSAHHWSDVAAGLRECRRISAPGAALLVVERRIGSTAHGLHAAHGFTGRRAEEVAAAAFDAGYAHVDTETVVIGRKPYVVVQARRDG